MRTIRQIFAMLLCSWLAGCGSESGSVNTTDSNQTQIAADVQLITEQPWTNNRAAGSICTLTDLSLLEDHHYLVVADYADNTVVPLPAIAPDANHVQVDMSGIETNGTDWPTKLSLYQLSLPKTETSISPYATQDTATRATTDYLNCIVLHGQWSDSNQMDTMAQTAADTNLFRGVYRIQYDWSRNISKEAASIKLLLGHNQYGSFLGSKRVVILAHSQGGIEARYMIEKLGLDQDVSTLIMFGTPNNGAAAFNQVTAKRIDLAALIALMTGQPLAASVLFGVDVGVTLSDAPVRQLSEGSSFLADLNQPSHVNDVTYVTVAGDTGNYSDGLVKVSSCEFWKLNDEAKWIAWPKLVGIDHSGLRWRDESMSVLKKVLKQLYPNQSTDQTTSYTYYGVAGGNTGNPSSGSTTAGTSTSPTSDGTTGGATPTTPTTTITQTVLTHPASEWDYGQNGFWHSEGKWHAAARRVDVGPPLEPVQMDGRDGRLKSGVSGRGFSCQRCRNGILVNHGSDVLGIKGEFYDHYRQRGGPTGELGCLTTEQRYDQRSGVSGRNGEWAQFEGGFLTKFDGLTATVLGDYARVWNGKGKGQGELGYPQDFRRSVKSGAPQFVNISGGWGQYQPFEGGSISEWSQTEHVVTGGFDREYRRVGGPGGPLGYPQTGKRTGVRSGCSARRGEEQIFQFGRIGELGVNNAWAVYGEILKRYSGPEYHHGFPLGPSENNNHRQRFEEYYISW